MKYIQDLKTYLIEHKYKIEVFRSAAFYNVQVQKKTHYGHRDLEELIEYSSPFYDINETHEFSIETKIEYIGEENEMQDILEFRFVDFDNKRINNTEYGDDLLTEIMGSLCFQGYKGRVVYPEVDLELMRYINDGSSKYHEFLDKKEGNLFLRSEDDKWYSVFEGSEVSTNTKISLEIAFQQWRYAYISNSINSTVSELKRVLESKGLQSVMVDDLVNLFKDNKDPLSLFTEKLKHLTK